MKETARQAIQNFYAARWGVLSGAGLHSVDKALVSRNRYVHCQEVTGRPAELLSFKLADPVPSGPRVRPQIPPEDVRVVDSAEQTVETRDGVEKRAVNTTSVFVAKDHDDWKALLFEGEYEPYREGRCPGVAPAEG